MQGCQGIEPPNAPDSTPLAAAHDLLEAYRRRRKIRRFEEVAADLYRDGKILGFVHLSIGQGACAVGACWPVQPDGVVTSNHRGRE